MIVVWIYKVCGRESCNRFIKYLGIELVGYGNWLNGRSGEEK